MDNLEDMDNMEKSQILDMFRVNQNLRVQLLAIESRRLIQTAIMLAFYYLKLPPNSSNTNIPIETKLPSGAQLLFKS